MRKKIEELRNKEEGFTLVELLAVIVILGIIVAIAIPAVGSVIDRAGSDADEAEQALVADAARLYVTTQDIPEKDWVEGKSKEISVEALYLKGYLDDRSKEGDNNKLSGNVVVTRKPITGTDTYTYTYDATKVTKATD